ncbi:ribokinase [Nonomuraea sp. NPDC049784]|uniref:ribokinase n=1 Tax=Nonomuraea sp. NPDC049784 TaxID=3154361 RepID=UPI00340AF3C9
MLVIGSVNVDLGLRIDRFPNAGQTIGATSMFEGSGGKGANQALAAARLDGRVGLLAAIGSDAASALEPLRDAGVDLRHLVEVPGMPSGRAVLLITGDDNAIVVTPGANSHLAPEHIRSYLAASEPPRVVVLQHEIPRETVEFAIRAFAGRSRVVLNPSPYREVPADLLDLVDVLVMNAGELADLSGAPTPQSVDEARDLLVRTPITGDVVVTVGADGALVRTAGRLSHVPSPRVAVDDTVGAGDAFLGALVARLCEGDSLDRAAQWAAAAAAIAVSGTGAVGGDLNRFSVGSLLASMNDAVTHP